MGHIAHNVHNSAKEAMTKQCRGQPFWEPIKQKIYAALFLILGLLA